MNDFQILWRQVCFWLSTLELHRWTNDNRGRKYQVDERGRHLSNVLRKKEAEIWMEGFLEGANIARDAYFMRDQLGLDKIVTIINNAGYEYNDTTHHMLLTVYRAKGLASGRMLSEWFKEIYDGDMRYEQFKIKR